MGPMVILKCKKKLSLFPSPAGMSLTKLSQARKNLIIAGLFYSVKRPHVWMRSRRGCCYSAEAAGLLVDATFSFISYWSWEGALGNILVFLVELYSDPSRSLITYMEGNRVRRGYWGSLRPNMCFHKRLKAVELLAEAVWIRSNQIKSHQNHLFPSTVMIHIHICFHSK
jgi:hypothetical protein